MPLDPRLIDTTQTNPLAQDIPSEAPPPLPVRSPEQMRALGQRLSALFRTYEADRRMAEIRWMKNLRQRLGQYDPEIESQLDATRSKAYPKLTRVKCVSMLARLMHLLFSGGEKNWGIMASPVPNLSEGDMAQVLALVEQTAQGQPVEDIMIETAIRNFAAPKAVNLEREIEDQLGSIGGDKMVDYVSLVRKVLMSGITYGMGIMKGPYARSEKHRRWQRDDQGKLSPLEVDALMPQFDFCSIWDYYPDMSARYFHQMDGQFERQVMSRQQLRELADKPEFFGSIILKYLEDHQQGNYKARPFESELKNMGPQINSTSNDGRKYEILIWDGYLGGEELQGAGVEVESEDLTEQVRGVIWMIDGTVIRASLSPWEILEEDAIKSYHHFVFEEDDSSLVGQGLPQIMRDSQMGVCAATRMTLDNASVVCGQNLEVNTELLRADQDVANVHAHKTWYRDDTGVSATIPAVRSIPIDSHIQELREIITLFTDFADKETFVSPATGGDMSKAPSEPYRTAAGASMIKGDAALPFKDVVRNFDQFTYSVFSALLAFNRHFNPKESIKGDFQPVPRGSTSLMAKEVLGMQYDVLAQSLNDQEKLYIDWRGLLKARLQVRDMDVDLVMCSDAEAKQREESQAKAQQAQQQQQAELLSAEVRKLLADSVKALTQSDANTAKGNAATYNSILAGLEKGVTPTDVAMSRHVGTVPDGIEETQKRLNPPKLNGGGH